MTELQTQHYIAHTLGGFIGGFTSKHGRKPTEQEIWNHAIRSFKDLNPDLSGGHPITGTHGVPFYECRRGFHPTFHPCTKEEYDSCADWNRKATYPFTEAEYEAIDALLSLSYWTWNALDNSEQRMDTPEAQQEIVIHNDYADPLSLALERIEALPDDCPGYVMEAAAKARWALRRVFDQKP